MPGPRPITASTDTDAAVFDAGVLAAVQRLIPPDRLNNYLEELDRQQQRLIDCQPGDPSLPDRAHKIVSQAGMLGLTRMSNCARALENACRSGAGQALALRRCRAAAGDVRRYAMPDRRG